MHLLITGGAGFIGSHFVRFWRTHHPEDHVTVIDLLTYAGNLENLEDVPKHDGHYHFVQGDIRDTNAVHAVFEGVDTVVHFAAESHVDRSIEGSRIFLETNILGTHTLLEETRRRGDQIKRFHHVSTDEVFGSLPLHEGDRFRETTPYAPRSPYATSKAASDQLCDAYVETHSLPITRSNCSNNYGPYHFPEKFIPRAITSLLEGKPIPVYGQGLNVRDWLHVEDHCAAIEAILLRGSTGRSYTVGGDAERSSLDVARMILSAFHIAEADGLIFVADRKGHDLRYAIDHTRITTELGWHPRIPFADGLKSTIDWYQTHASWWKPLLEKATLSHTPLP